MVAEGLRCSLSYSVVCRNSTTGTKTIWRGFGAEEVGLVGSKHYVDNMPSSDVDALMAYLNFELVSRGYWGGFDSNSSAQA